MDLREFRKVLGLTVEQAAEQLAVGKGTLSKIERGESNPGGELLLRINGWAEAARIRKRLPVSCRLDWNLKPKRRRSGPVPETAGDAA
jgi:transcriptional regulator with XRE-family HTH domain